MQELESYINSYFGISGHKGKEIQELFEYQELPKGKRVIRAGVCCDQLSFIQSGYFRVFRHHNEKDVTQYISSPGDFVADLSSLMFQKPARVNIQSLTPARLYTINQKSFQQISQIVPQWNQLEKLFLAKCFMVLEDRVFSFLSMTAQERYEHLFSYNPEIFNIVPLHYIASMLGMTPETLSRIRSRNS